uniref:Dual oxidase maturation factor 2 n=1 Tax=Nothobranchius furzeri TaxID=105023 RepID=A0A8C6PRN7_NOTFU
MTFYDDIYPFYPLQRTSFSFSGRLLTIILVFLVLAVSLLLILPGIRGRTRLFWLFRIITSLFIGVVLVGNPIVQFNETIDYNEMFSWHSTIEEEYEKALEKGLPNPILYIVEKFTLSSPCGLIYQYRHSGRFASATLWTAFCCWMLTNILFSMPVILYAGYMMMTTAAFIFFSMVSFSTIMNVPHCVFSIGTDSFVTEYSQSFWLALATGVLCTIIGILVVTFNFLMPEKMKAAFSVGVDSCEDEEDSCGEGYLNSVFMDGSMILPLTTKTTAVSQSHRPQRHQ